MRLMNVNYATEAATTVSASNINANFPVSNIQNPFRSKRVRTADGTTTLAIVFDLQTAEAIDSVVFLWPKEDGIQLSGSAVIKIQANATNTWTSPSVDQTLTISDDYVMASHYFTSDQSYRYWRAYISDPGNGNDYVELGIVWLGKSMSLPNAQNGFSYDLQDRSKVTTNDFGHSYVDEFPLQASLEFTYQFLDYADVQTLENAFRQNGTKDPVLVVIDAEEAVFDKDHMVVYGRFSSKFGLKHYSYDILNPTGITITELS
jgi:hypothetical protein